MFSSRLDGDDTRVRRDRTAPRCARTLYAKFFFESDSRMRTFTKKCGAIARPTKKFLHKVNTAKLNGCSAAGASMRTCADARSPTAMGITLPPAIPFTLRQPPGIVTARVQFSSEKKSGESETHASCEQAEWMF